MSFGCRFCAHTPAQVGQLVVVCRGGNFTQLWEQPVTGTVRSFCVSKFQRRRAASPDRPHWLSREMGPLAAQGTDPVIGGADHHAAPPSSSLALCPTISTAVAARACLLSALSALAVVDSVVVLSTSVKFCNFGRWLWPPYFISHSISDPDTWGGGGLEDRLQSSVVPHKLSLVVAKTAPPSRTSATAYGRHRWQSAAPFPPILLP